MKSAPNVRNIPTNRVAHFRRLAVLSVAELEKHSNVSTKTITRAEHGDGKLSERTRLRLHDALRKALREKGVVKDLKIDEVFPK